LSFSFSENNTSTAAVQTQRGSCEVAVDLRVSQQQVAFCSAKKTSALNLYTLIMSIFHATYRSFKNVITFYLRMKSYVFQMIACGVIIPCIVISFSDVSEKHAVSIFGVTELGSGGLQRLQSPKDGGAGSSETSELTQHSVITHNTVI
jgi:hypothetical protein